MIGGRERECCYGGKEHGPLPRQPGLCQGQLCDSGQVSVSLQTRPSPVKILAAVLKAW